MNRGISISIDRLYAPQGIDASSLADRLAREISDRRFGPGADVIVTQIADRIVDAVESSEDHP